MKRFSAARQEFLVEIMGIGSLPSGFTVSLRAFAARKFLKYDVS